MANVHSHSFRNRNMYQPTLPAYFFLCFQKNKFKYEHVGTCLFHKTPFFILFGPVLGHYWGYVRPNIPLRSSQNCNVYWPTLLAKYSSLNSMNMKGRVRTIKPHFSSFLGLFWGVSMARYTFSFLPKSKYVSVYITSLLFSHEYTKKFKHEYVESCFCHKIPFSLPI